MAQPEIPPISIEQYALVLCAKDEGAPLEVALELAAVPPQDWPAAEAHHTARLSLAASDPAVLPAFDDAMRAARAQLARPVTPIDEDAASWGRWLRVWSSAPDPMGMLARSGMDVADVVRLSTSWGERLKDDRALAEAFAAEMQGSSPAPEVHVAESPRLAAARAAVAARRAPAPTPSVTPVLTPPLDKASRPSLMAAFPGEIVADAPAPRVVSPAPPSIAEPLPAAVADTPPVESRAVPSFMAARPGPVSPPAVSPPAPAPSGAKTAPLPVFFPGVPVIASAPLPFDPTARPEEMPSQGQQLQSGLTGDVDLSAIVRKVLAFQAPGGAPPAPEVAPPKAPIGETTGVDVAAIARQVLAFGPQKKVEAPPAPPVPVPALAPVPSPAVPIGSAPPAAPVTPAPPAPVVPTLTAEQYASLCVDLEMQPAQSAEILRRYGTNEPGKRVLDDGWSRVFAEQPARRAAFENAKAAYRTWLSKGGRR